MAKNTKEKEKENEVEILVDFGDEGGGLRPVSRGGEKIGEVTGELVQKSKDALDKAMDTIKGMAARTIETAKKITDPPDAIEVEFGIKLDAEAGAMVAKAGTEASINVKMSWRPKERPMAKLPSVGFIRSPTNDDDGEEEEEREV